MNAYKFHSEDEPKRWRDDPQAPNEIAELIRKIGEPHPPYGAEERVLARIQKGLRITVKPPLRPFFFPIPQTLVVLLLLFLSFSIAYYIRTRHTVEPANPKLIASQNPPEMTATLIVDSGGVTAVADKLEKTIKKGDSLIERNIIKTGVKGFGIFALGETATVYLDKNTSLSIEKLANDKVELALLAGAASFSVSPRSSDNPFLVKTQNALVRVVGTIFSVTLLRTGQTFVSVQKGVVELNGAGIEKKLLKTGETATVGEKEEREPHNEPIYAAAKTAERENKKEPTSLLAKKWTKEESLAEKASLAKENELFAEALDLQYEKGDYKNAVVCWKRYIAQFPSGIWREDATFHLGYALIETGEIANAKKTLSDFLSAYPSAHRAAEARFLLGNIARINLGDCDAAVPEYEHALSLERLPPILVEEARRSIAECKNNN
ncbi:MAG: hypothetical protein Kow0090_05470 [Myxococcota bacterium]